MRSFQTWFRENDAGRPWLILGKGPSLSKLPQFATSDYSLISLNHAVRDACVDVAHFVDWDAFCDVAERCVSHARFTVLPWQPHIDFKPSRKNLSQLVATHPFARKLAEQGR